MLNVAYDSHQPVIICAVSKCFNFHLWIINDPGYYLPSQFQHPCFFVLQPSLTICFVNPSRFRLFTPSITHLDSLYTTQIWGTTIYVMNCYNMLQNSKQSIVHQERFNYRLYGENSSPQIHVSPSSSHLCIKENYSFLFNCLNFKRFAKWYLFSGLRYFGKESSRSSFFTKLPQRRAKFSCTNIEINIVIVKS